jgi:hypothetical protein
MQWFLLPHISSCAEVTHVTEMFWGFTKLFNAEVFF